MEKKRNETIPRTLPLSISPPRYHSLLTPPFIFNLLFPKQPLDLSHYPDLKPFLKSTTKKQYNPTLPTTITWKGWKEKEEFSHWFHGGGERREEDGRETAWATGGCEVRRWGLRFWDLGFRLGRASFFVFLFFRVFVLLSLNFSVPPLLISAFSIYPCKLGFRLVYKGSKEKAFRNAFGCSELEFSLFDDRF